MTDATVFKPRAAIAGFVVLALWFILLLGARPLNVPDEGRYTEVAREMMLSGDYVTPRVNGVVFLDKPPLYYWLSSLSLRAFGVHEWSARFVSALFGIFGCVVTFLVARRAFGMRAAWLAMGVMASSPLYFLSSQYADMNLTVAVLISSSLGFFLLGTFHPPGDARRRHLMWLAYLCAAFATLTKGLIGIVFPMAIIGLWILLRRDWKLLTRMYLGSGMAIYLVVTIPWFVLAQRANPDFLHFFFVYQHFTRFSGTGFNNPNPVWFYLPVILIGMFPWTFAVGQAAARAIGLVWRSPQQEAAALFLVIWMLFVLAFFSIPQSKVVGYILPVVPPLAMLTGALLVRLPEHSDASASARSNLYLYSALASVFAVAIFVVEFRPPRKLVGVPGISLDETIVGLVLLASAIAVTALTWQRRYRSAGVAMLVSGFAFIVAIYHAASTISPHSIKPLALELRSMLRPGDVVATYQEYYQDLPVYLGLTRPVVVITELPESSARARDNWKREFKLGLEQDPRAQAWIVRDEWLEGAARGDARLFVVGPTNIYADLHRRFGLIMIQTQGNTAIYSNRELPLPESPVLSK